jgi:hypothetical protein
MQDGNAPRNAAKNKPQQQTGEEFGSIRRGQLDDRSMPERSDTARGSETETRSAASRRG